MVLKINSHTQKFTIAPCTRGLANHDPYQPNAKQATGAGPDAGPDGFIDAGSA
eukprot:SAG31_NODE_41777_length_274_cov_0.982857_1_plen_52_part_10